MRRKRAFAGQEWSNRDAYVIGVGLTLLLAGTRWTPLFYAAVAYAAGLGTYWLIRYVERRRAEAANTAPYWTERLKDDD